jgi:hypothetical protein
MKNSNKDQVSPFIKVILDKVHGGRKQDSKFWQRGVAGSRNDCIGFKNEEIPLEKPEGLSGILKITKGKRRFFGVGMAVICCVFSFVYFRPDLFLFLSYSKIYQTISEYFPEKNEDLHQIGPSTTSHSLVLSTESQDYNFSPDQVSRAKRNVIETQRNKSNFIGKENLKDNSPIKSFKDNKHRYEIELSSGRYVYADSVIVSDDKITFENKRGLVVSVNRNEVKTMKRLN